MSTIRVLARSRDVGGALVEVFEQELEHVPGQGDFVWYDGCAYIVTTRMFYVDSLPSVRLEMTRI